MGNAYPPGEGTPSKWLTWYLQGCRDYRASNSGMISVGRHRLSHWRAFDCGLPDLTQGRFISVSLHEDLGFDRGVARIPVSLCPAHFRILLKFPLERSRGRAL